MSQELERYKTTCLAQEAEIARLQAGFDELKQWALTVKETPSHGQYDRGVDVTIEILLVKLNIITGESK